MKTATQSPWLPLEHLEAHRDDVKCGDFMLMDVTPARSTSGKSIVVHLYKNGDTRRYLILDWEGNAYRYVAALREYALVALDDAIAQSYSF